MAENPEHVPVLLEETLAALDIKPGGTYVDCTLGGGGHSLKILEKVADGMLIAVDRDPAAIEAFRARSGEARNLVLVNSNFSEIERILEHAGCDSADGFLFDLGLSSIQLADEQRGFSFQTGGTLDMRFDPDSDEPSAAQLVNTLSEEQLVEIFKKYGQKKPYKLARRIAAQRQSEPIRTARRLADIVAAAVPAPRSKRHPATKVFMALRIEANRELESLDTALPAAIARTRPGGRIAVICYHSLEERIVKDRFRRAAKGCTCEMPPEHCFCTGDPSVKIITKKPVVPEEEEIRSNARARSGRLRVAERI